MYKIRYLKNLHREIRIPPDKSISHRILMISSLCQGGVSAGPVLLSEDVMATADCLRKTGVDIKFKKDGFVSIKGKGMYLPRKRRVILPARESGTTMRILSGLLSAQKFPSQLWGAHSLSRRPMGRVVYPLR
ncbi:MAG: 3-phosphoshikimate 1-carboxyvinyltransferase, partial [Candidatus Omnitrophica bacterium]|nr:3-phosphoshikimate 1-carboxyvinyltransferase [Candidatus Omnitrophota bacterium]MBD3268993.1 3-phosphoshikimate 1-carboxyvinyltransferase [Candidatus Omnitrophota bacterium]